MELLGRNVRCFPGFPRRRVGGSRVIRVQRPSRHKRLQRPFLQQLHDEGLCQLGHSHSHSLCQLGGQLGGGAKKGAEPSLLAIARRHPRYTAHTPWDESGEAEGQLVENGLHPV